MKIYVKHGITSLDDMKEHYNKFQQNKFPDGGDIGDGGGNGNGKFKFNYETPSQKQIKENAYQNPDQYLNRSNYLREHFGINDELYKKEFGKKWYKETYSPIMERYYSGNESQKNTVYALRGVMNGKTTALENDYWSSKMSVEEKYRRQVLENALNDSQNKSIIEAEYNNVITPLVNASNYVNDYYNSDAYKARAMKHGVYNENPISDNVNIIVKDLDKDNLTLSDLLNNRLMSHKSGDEIVIMNMPGDAGSVEAVMAHELGHYNPLYNTKKDPEKEYSYPEDDRMYSRYYMNDYTNVPAEYVDYLYPTIGLDKINDHDRELSENYSDLIGLREALYRHGIFDSSDGSIFTQEMLDKFRKTGEANRFLRYHTDEQIINALNEVAYNEDNQNVSYAAYGGKIRSK